MTKELDSDAQWNTKRPLVELALTKAEQAKAWAQEIAECSPELHTWVTKWEQEADALITSYTFFLEVSPVPSCYRFAAWIHCAQFLLNDMQKTLTLFDTPEVKEEQAA